MNDYCQHRLLIVGSARELKQFHRNADWKDIAGATDTALAENSSTRIVWQFVAVAPALKSLRIMSRRWPCLTFLLTYDCEDCHLIGMVRAKNGRLRQHRFHH
jgi:hypothetical protein